MKIFKFDQSHPISMPTAAGFLKGDSNLNFQIVIIPGNPGVIDFYFEYAKILQSLLKTTPQVWIFSHAGHFKESSGIFHLEDQIKHKRSILHWLHSQFPHMKSIVMTHSIGSYLTLLALDESLNKQIKAIINLFPTIENIKNGFDSTTRILASKVGKHLIPQMLFGLPKQIRDSLTNPMLKKSLIKNKTLSDLVDKQSFKNILHLAHQEGQFIKDIDSELEKNMRLFEEKLIFYYCSKDAYTPQPVIEKFKNQFNSEVHIFTPPCPHAFVINHSLRIAQIITKHSLFQ